MSDASIQLRRAHHAPYEHDFCCDRTEPKELVGDGALSGQGLSRHKLEGGDHAGLLALIDRMRERAAFNLPGCATDPILMQVLW